MFLVTTAYQSFWNKDEPVLFLGEWCRVYSQKHVWSKLQHEVLPYHGCNRGALFDDYKYSRHVYERSLVQLAQVLNKLHQTKHSVRYWRIVLGPWLSLFIGIFLDRYRSICAAADSGKVTNTWITGDMLGKFIASNTPEFEKLFVGDEYNHFLYSQIIRLVGRIPWEEKKDVGFSPFVPEVSQRSLKKNLKQCIARLIRASSRSLPYSLQNIFLFDSYIKPIDLVRLQFSIGALPSYSGEPTAKVPFVKANNEMRREINFDLVENEFESILTKCIPFQIPKIFLENYSNMVQEAEKVFPKKPKVVLTANGHVIKEEFKFWIASKVEQGVKLAVTQHGGNVGDALWSSADDHELEISDRYFTWGWTSQDKKKCIPMPSSMLGSAKEKIKRDPQGRVLCVTCTFPKYSEYMLSAPKGPVSLKSFRFQEQFCQMVAPEVHALLTMRLFPVDRGWEERLRWGDSKVSPHIYQGNMSYYSHLARSRLCVCFYNGTPFLETFVANFPTVLCWDPMYAELNASARPYFSLLKNVGILHETPESAASKLNKIYQNPLSWWMSPRVQDAKNKFCDQFARVDNAWKAQWQEELSRLIV